MTAPTPRPEAPIPASLPRRTGVAGALAALVSVVPGLLDPEHAAESEGAARRIVQSLITGGGEGIRPELLTAGRTLLQTTPSAFAAGLREFLALLTQVAEARAARVEETVLIVEDDPVCARALELALAGPGRKLVVAANAAEAAHCLQTEPVTLLVLDLILPDRDGRALLLELRSDPRTAGIPVFVASARLGSQAKSECFALGADAYFEKPVDLAAFAVAVTTRLERHADCLRQTRRDAVTGLPNRAAFLEALDRIRAITPPGSPIALAVLDLDHFGWVDETWGRQYGDTILRRIGVRLAMALREAAIFARWDGAEFIALFPGRTAAEAGLTVDRARAMLRRVDFRSGETPPLTITFSAGVVDLAPGASVEEALAEGDGLRYVAKASGRNRVVTAGHRDAVPTRRILLAEDDPSISRLLIKHLRHEGFDVVAFPDGEQALANAPSVGASLIITDIEMPGLDGLGFLQQLREHPELRHIPVMMLTALGGESYIVRAFELGADDYVLKPFSLREVTARVRRLLRRPSLAGIPATL